MKIIVLQKYNTKVENLANIATINKLWYSEKNKYIFINDETNYELTDDRSDTWLIELSILNTMKKYPNCDWIFWTDIDSLIMNYNIKLEDIILSANNNEHIIACMWPFTSSYTFSDLNSPIIKIEQKPSIWYFLHTGNFLVRNSEWSYNFLLTLYNDKRFVLQDELRKHFMGDEIGITCYYLAYPHIRKHIKILSNQMFLSIANPFYNSNVKTYSHGDFIFHAPLQKLNKKEELLNKYIKYCEKPKI